MKWLPSLFKRQPDRFGEETVERYKQARAAGRELNMALVKELPKAAVPECGKKLGLVKAGTLILNNDDEIAILYDYCFHHYRRDGKNTIDRHLLNAPPPPGSVEQAVLDAMRASYYSLFRILEIHPRQGARLEDLVGGGTVDLLDISVSETGEAGTVLAGRVLPFQDFSMSSGTLIPLTEAVYEEKLKPVVRKFAKSGEPAGRPQMSDSQEAAFTAETIRVALHAGGEDNVFYTDIESA